MPRLFALLRISGRSAMAAFGLIAAMAAVAGDAMPVSIARVGLMPIAQEVRLTGELSARRRSALSSEVEGLVTALHVDDGDVVAAGDVIVTLDDAIARTDRAEAAAELTEARAREREARRRLAELERLVAQKHVSRTEVDSAAATVDIASAAIGRARARRDRTDALLARHTVAAPFAGVVARKRVELGQWVDTGTALVDLVETEYLRLEIPVPQYYFARLAPGAPVAIQFDALPDETVTATVTALIPVSDTSARTFPVRIDLYNSSGRLVPGMSARVALEVSRDDKPSVVVPRDAVVRKPDGTETVWAIAETDGVTRAVPRTIVSGRAWHDYLEVVDGDVQPGLAVVIRGNELLRPDQPVRVAEEITLSDN